MTISPREIKSGVTTDVQTYLILVLHVSDINGQEKMKKESVNFVNDEKSQISIPSHVNSTSDQKSQRSILSPESSYDYYQDCSKLSNNCYSASEFSL